MNGKYFRFFYPTGILGQMAREDKNKNVGIRSQPIKRTRLLQAQYVPWTSVREGQGSPAPPLDIIVSKARIIACINIQYICIYQKAKSH